MSTGGAAIASAHLPVMFAEVMDGLAVKVDGTYLDGTFGRGGHARGVLQRLGPGGRLRVMDKDPEAIEVARQLASDDARVSWHRGSFADLPPWKGRMDVLDEAHLEPIHGIQLTLGRIEPTAGAWPD